MRALRPVGNRILPCRNAGGAAVGELAPGYRVRYLSCGTAALALAIKMACKRNSTRSPEVILPGYGCPDLVAAAVYAGARPVLADLARESPHYDPGSIAALLRPDTVAIVAATFVGIRPHAGRLRGLIGDRNIVLIEDSAQWFPRTSAQRFFGDYVIVSFGRGKPVNVLGGGALLVAQDMEMPPLSAPSAGTAAWIDAAKLTFYNLLIHPRIYGIAENMPFLGIGLTKYHPLHGIAGMPHTHLQRLNCNLRQYQERSLDVQHQWRRALESLKAPHIIDLYRTHDVPEDYAALRYPILVDSASRYEELYRLLKRHRLGASCMYAKALPDLQDVRPHIPRPNAIPHARDFAARLLTLPAHDDVDHDTVQRTLDILTH